MKKYYVLLFLLNLSCLSAMELIAHRGSPNYPENSKEGIQYALAEGYDGVEIDIQPLKYENTPVFALSHDLVVNREVDTNIVKNTLSFSAPQWSQLQKKDRHGKITSCKATTLSEVLKVFKKNANMKQVLNIEIKSPMVNVYDMLTVLQNAKVNISQIQISSLYLDKLVEIRKYSSNVYLGYITQPNKTSLKHTAQVKVDQYINSSKLNMFLKNKIDEVQKYAERNNVSTLIDISTLQTKLKDHFGVHLDYADLKEHTKYIKKLNHLHIPVYVYSLDKSITPTDVTIYLKETNIKIAGMITDNK